MTMNLEIRLDANGSFTASNALRCLDRLSGYDIHSIEQPVAAGQPELMKHICEVSPIDIALDEELIGFRTDGETDELLGWRPTSALESNIGLNAIAQWVSAKDNQLVQGLGTGELYENNIESPLAMDGANLIYRPERRWTIPDLSWRV